jgi:hypothetical protein
VDAGGIELRLLLLLLLSLQLWLEQSAGHWPDTPQHTYARHGKGNLAFETRLCCCNYLAMYPVGTRVVIAPMGSIGAGAVQMHSCLGYCSGMQQPHCL